MKISRCCLWNSILPNTTVCGSVLPTFHHAHTTTTRRDDRRLSTRTTSNARKRKNNMRKFTCNIRLDFSRSCLHKRNVYLFRTWEIWLAEKNTSVQWAQYITHRSELTVKFGSTFLFYFSAGWLFHEMYEGVGLRCCRVWFWSLSDWSDVEAWPCSPFSAGGDAFLLLRDLLGLLFTRADSL